MDRADIVVVGAGPTGLMLTNVAARHGLSVIVLERDSSPRNNATAIGISPPSIEILGTIGLAEEVIRRGVRVRRLVFHGPSGPLGNLQFDGLGSGVDFVLSIPQDRLAAVLEGSLAGRPGVRVQRGCEVKGFRAGAEDIVVTARCAGQDVEIAGRYAVACDSGRSLLRETAGIPFDGGEYADRFVMGDFEDRTLWGDEAHIFFTPLGSVESFPLPDGQRRYVLPSPALEPVAAVAFLKEQVRLRSGVDLSGSRPVWSMPFGVRRFMARRYREGRLLLAGDAAHVMSPTVGQNLNTGLADAELLALALRKVIAENEDAHRWFGFYERTRRRAADAAALRAWFMMRFGTSGGRVWSPVRNRLVGAALCTRVRRPLARIFSMLSIPNRNLASMAVEAGGMP